MEESVLARLKLDDPTLTSLKFGTGHINTKYIAKAIKSNRLISVEFAWNFYSENEMLIIINALKSNTSLQVLGLDGSIFNYDTIKSLAEILRHNYTLTTLSLNFCVGMIDFYKIVKSVGINKSLKRLELREVGFGSLKNSSNIMFALSAALKNTSTLEYLDIGGNSINAEHVHILVTGLKYNTSITKLILGSNNMRADGFKNGAYAIADMLRINSTLQVLDINQTRIEYGVVLKALHSNTTLQEISFWCNGPISPENCYEIGEMLKNNQSIHTICLSYNKIDSLDMIADGLLNNRSLTSLNLDNCNLKNLKPLICALEKNTTLTNLTVFKNGFSTDHRDVVCINEMLKKNKAGLQSL